MQQSHIFENVYRSHFYYNSLHVCYTVLCDFFLSLSLRDVFLADGSRVSVATVASTAIAAAQWAVTQVPTARGNGLI